MNGPRAFRIDPPLARLRDAYPESEEILETVVSGRGERSAVARLWIAEGIPFAFRNCPALYEKAREWLAVGLDVDPKEVSICGSGRLGYSLAPDSWGRPYSSQDSDLDLFAVSERLFDGLRRDFDCWSQDFEGGAVAPRSQQEEKYWTENKRGTPGCIARGFIDSWRVPNLTPYSAFCRNNNRLAGLKARLHATDVGPKPPRRMSLRCYRDWGSYESQATINLKFAADQNRRPA